jgi:predicted PurR-regulated permease PerM
MQSPGTSKPETVAYKVVLFVLAIAFLIWLLITLKTLVTCVIVGLTLAAAIAPFAEWAENHKVPRPATVIGVYVAILTVYVALAVLLTPLLREQAAELYEHVPHYVDSVIGAYNKFITFTGMDPQASPIKVDDFKAIAPRLVSQTVGITAGVFAVLLNVVLVLFLTGYFVIAANDIWPKLLRWVPPNKRAAYGELIRPLGARMGGYVRGQAMVSVAVAIFLGTGLTIIGVHYSLVLGVLAGFLNLVPYAGSFTTMALALVVATNQSLLLGALTLGLFMLEQWCESTFLIPQLLGRQVELHPLIVLFAIITGATLMGLPGALIAIPLTSAGLYLAEEFYVRPLNFTTASEIITTPGED